MQYSRLTVSSRHGSVCLPLFFSFPCLLTEAKFSIKLNCPSGINNIIRSNEMFKSKDTAFTDLTQNRADHVMVLLNALQLQTSARSITAVVTRMQTVIRRDWWSTAPVTVITKGMVIPASPSTGGCSVIFSE